MGLREQITTDIKTAMKERNMEKLNALRLVQAAFKNREIELRPNPINEDELITVLKKLCKQRKESIEQYQQANRQDLVDGEAAELKLLEAYLPAQMSRDKVEEIVTSVIRDLKATSVKEMGAVMKETIARTSGTADNKVINEIVRTKLN